MKALSPRQRIAPAFYEDDLAFIHDAGFSHYAKAAALLVLETLRSVGIGNGRIVELGCGSGVSSRVFREAGFDIVGFDSSESLIRLAREHVPDAEFHVGSFVTAPIPQCVAVTAISEVLNYTFDTKNSSAARKELFRRIHEALDSGGLFICDIAEPRRAPANGVRRSFVLDENWAVLVESEANNDKTELTRRVTSFRQQNGLYRRSAETHRLQLIERAEILGQLKAKGFSVRVIRSYGPRPLLPGIAGFLARKSHSRHAAMENSRDPQQKTGRRLSRSPMSVRLNGN